MKAERRHELKHNELADWIGERVETIRPHAAGIALGVGVLLVIVLGSLWYFSGENAATSRSWSQYFDAFNGREPQKVLQTLAAEQSGSKAAWWALAAVGDMNLSEGAALMHSDRTEARKHLEVAEQAYKKVELSDDPMLKSRARLGLAKVYESMCQPKEAKKYYEMVATADKNSAIGKAAAADAKRMDDSRNIAFLEWFANQTPKRPAAFPGMGGSVPGLPNDLPERPDISLPNSFGIDVGSANPAAPPPAFPAPGGAAPPADSPPEPAAPDASKTAAPQDKAQPAAKDASEKKSE